MDTVPNPVPMPDGRASIHGTALACRGRGLLILGPAGAGKSGLAAQLIAFGGCQLVSDDLVVLSEEDAVPVARPPDGRPQRLELRGLFPVATPSARQTALHAALLLAPSTARLPQAERFSVLGVTIPLWRHPATPDLAAKVLLALETAPR